MKLNILGHFRSSRLKYIWYFLKPYPHYALGITALSILSAFFDGMNVLILFSVLNKMMGINGQKNLEGGILLHINSLVNTIPIKDSFIAACLLLLASVVLRNAFIYLQNVYSSYAGYRIWQDTQEKVYLKLIYADYQYFLNHKQGELLYRVDSAPGALGAVLKIVPQVFVEFTKLLAVGSVLIGISPYASGAIVLVGVAYYYFTKHVAVKISYNYGKGRVDASQRQLILLNETIGGIRQIKVFASEKRWTNEFFRAMQDYFKLAILDSRWIALPASLLDALTIAILVSLLVWARVFSPDNFASLLPVLGVFAYAFQKILPSLSQLGNLRIQVMGILPSVELLYSAFTERSQVVGDGKIMLDTFKHEIKFEDVYFSYPGRDKVLRDVKMSFKKGQTTAIVGPSGAGKSTIADLIVRLFVPHTGKVLVDGVDLRECAIASWLSKIGFVTQDTFIFHASIKENIAFGLNVSDEEIVQAAKEANAHAFIMEFPNGYETVVGDRGMKMSGGQRQRLAIARALVRKPEVLILDEATSSLDNLSEAQVQNAISKISENRTVIVIAHRLSTIVNADKIIVIDQGVVIEEGTHNDLILMKGIYWKLYNKEKSGSTREML